MNTSCRLEFARSSLLYDIANYAYIESHKLEIDEDAPLRAHLLSDITAAGNVDRVSRVLALVYAEVVQMLRQWVVADTLPAALTDTLYAPDVYEIEILPPRWIDKPSLDLLSKLIHEYMVCRTIYDWLSITHPAYGTPWQQNADLAAASIRCLLTGRITTTRPLHPF